MKTTMDVHSRHDIRGWFPQQHEDKLLEIIKEHDIKTVIEIGSFLGKSTAFFAENCERVYAIDPFVIWQDFIKDAQPRDGLTDDFFPMFWGNIHTLGLAKKVYPIRTLSTQAEHILPWLSADLIYIDGSHDYDSVRLDIMDWTHRAGRVICGDDYGEHWPGVKQAVDECFGDVQLTASGLWYKIYES